MSRHKKPDQGPARAVGYVRVSTDEQAKNGLSLEGQRERIEAYTRMRGIELVEVITDAGVSGGVPLTDRPGGRRVAELVKCQEIDSVVVVKLDRAFRNTVDCLSVASEWEKREVGLHILDLGGNAVDTQSASGRFVLTVLAGVAEMERMQIKERCDVGRAQARKKGKPLSKAVPYGFQNKNGRLVPDTKEQATARKMKRLRERGLSLRKIAELLNREGVQTKHGARWKAVQVSRALRAVELRAFV